MLKELLQLHNKDQPNFEMDKISKKTFHQRRCTNGQQARGEMLNVCSFQGMQIKVTMRCHNISTRIAVSKRQINTSVGGDVEKLDPHTLG